MEIVEYKKSLQWVGTMQCPKCSHITNAWQSSGMSECYPHFYCTKCSNVIHRTKDKDLIYNGNSQDLLDQISSDLPKCPCGGQFQPNENPKCSNCNEQFTHQGSEIERLSDPHMIVVDGACVFSDEKGPYMVKIVDE